MKNFNSHAHVERDAYIMELLEFKNISTHTLTWSVTSQLLALTVATQFQLTRSRGA